MHDLLQAERAIEVGWELGDDDLRARAEASGIGFQCPQGGRLGNGTCGRLDESETRRPVECVAEAVLSGGFGDEVMSPSRGSKAEMASIRSAISSIVRAVPADGIERGGLRQDAGSRHVSERRLEADRAAERGRADDGACRLCSDGEWHLEVGNGRRRA